MHITHERPEEAHPAERTRTVSEPYTLCTLMQVLDAADIGLWDCNPASGEMYCDDRIRVLWGLPLDQPVTFEQFCAAVHREDRERLRNAIVETAERGTGAHRRLEYRIVGMHGRFERWIATDGCTRVGSGPAVRVIGTVRDISWRKANELHQSLIRQELEHRIKNIFAVMSAMIGLAARNARTPEQLVAATTDRLQALQRAHSLLIDSVAGSTLSLSQVLDTQLAPLAISPHTVTLSGEEVLLGPAPALSMSLIAHELATNALKHGSLAHPAGHLHVAWRVMPASGVLELRWKETGESQRPAPPKRGFGSELLSLCARLDLGGDITFEYATDGLLVTITVPIARLGAGRAHIPAPPTWENGHA